MFRPKIYVVLPVHNRVNVTSKFIDCLKKQTYENYHLILVDDGSTDGTAEYVKREIGNLTILYGNGNLWWAGSLNRAYKYLSKIKADDEDIVLINNDDTAFDEDYFENVINDRDLKPGTLIISPGHSTSSDFIERGFAIDWSSLMVYKLEAGQEPDAVTTRGLYMHYATYKSLGPFHPRLLPHYLSDLEYTIRAKRRGLKLVVSNSSHIHVDRSRTGSHIDNSKTLREFLFNQLVSKKTAYNAFYWGNFVLLAAPGKYKFRAFKLVYIRFYKKLIRFIKETYLTSRDLSASK